MAGFSLFELVVFIISVAIIYAYAANRFANFPAAAERANFLAVSTQLQSALNIELNYGLGRGGMQSPEMVVGANPMDFLLQPPNNYLGVFDFVDPSQIERRSWYFDRTRGQLVYLISDDRGVFLNVEGGAIPTDEIRFHIVADYGLFDSASGLPVAVLTSRGDAPPRDNLVRKLRGILLRPVTPFSWDGIDEQVLISAGVGT